MEDDMYSFKNDKPTRERDYSYKPQISVPLIILIGTAILCAIATFIATLINKDSSVTQIIMSAILSLFSILYLVVCLTSSRKNEAPVYITTILLIALFVLNMNRSPEETVVSQSRVQNFSGKTITDVVKWAKKNDLKVTQEYEYSDMVPEYEVISQNVKVGTDVRDIDEIVVAISEGPNPFK